MNNFTKLIVLAAMAALAAFGQLTTTSTTLSAGISANTTTQWCVASATGVVLPSLSGATNGSYLWVDREAAQVMSAGASSTCFNVKRGQLGTTANASHASASKVWVGAPATGSGDTSRPFTGAFVSSAPTGSCTASAQFTLPVIYTGPASYAIPGSVFSCVGGRWGGIADKMIFIPPSDCTFAPTTLTTTNTLTTVGASAVYVLNGTSNAAAGTNTLTCNILVPTAITAFQGAVITDITVMVGSQTTAPTSIGTSTLTSITFPTPATSETASTVTPVASAGGTVTLTTPTQITTVTTAGAFLTIKATYATPVPLSTDYRMLVFSLPFAQSAAAAMTLNTPGLLVHYSAPISLP